MKIIFVPTETDPCETRVALVPSSVKQLTELGLKIIIQSGSGEKSNYTDAEYEKAGASLCKDRREAFLQADIVLRVCKPSLEEVERLKTGCLHLSFLDPFNEQALVQKLAEQNVSAVSLEMLPRSTLSQKMDALSSQANLAGYYAVIKAAERLGKILPMMMTPAGTLSPAKFFIIGVGVAGLQAIATAKRLGARVVAFDTRSVVEEQVKSLGAKFLRIQLDETGQTQQGYAKELTPAQLEKQREGMTKACAEADVIITTAKLFGRKAPVIVTQDMIATMRRGSLIIDLAVAAGGNVEGSKMDEEVVTPGGVRLLGIGNMEGCVAHDASQMYSANLCHFIEHFWKDGDLSLPLEEEILQNCLLTHGGKILHSKFQKNT